MINGSALCAALAVTERDRLDRPGGIEFAQIAEYLRLIGLEYAAALLAHNPQFWTRLLFHCRHAVGSKS
jgi:hypothetical protein